MSKESELMDWLEDEIFKRFPDGVESIGSGRLRLRIFKLCSELKEKCKDELLQDV